MNNFIAKTIRLKTRSYVVLSPRGAQAFYRGIDFEDINFQGDNSLHTSQEKRKVNYDVNDREETSEKNINMIYPFYQYGTYDCYAPETAQYMIPGSSVKGSLLRGNNDKRLRSQIMIDDFEVRHNSIVLKKIWKCQYLKRQGKEIKGIKESEKQAKYNEFFPNIAFEMLIPGTEVCTSIYSKSNEEFDTIINKVKNRTDNKLREYIKYVELIKGAEKNNENFVKIMDDHIQAIEKLGSKNRNLMFIGGYKGLLRALNGNIKGEDRGAIFIDESTKLPYGIVELFLE